MLEREQPEGGEAGIDERCRRWTGDGYDTEEPPGGERGALGHAGDRKGERGEGGEVRDRGEQRHEEDRRLSSDVRAEPLGGNPGPAEEEHQVGEPQECNDHRGQRRGASDEIVDRGEGSRGVHLERAVDAVRDQQFTRGESDEDQRHRTGEVEVLGMPEERGCLVELAGDHAQTDEEQSRHQRGADENDRKHLAARLATQAQYATETVLVESAACT